jgi:hypothetical protein
VRPEERARRNVDRILKAVKRLEVVVVPAVVKQGRETEPERCFDPVEALFAAGRFPPSPLQPERVGSQKGAAADPVLAQVVRDAGGWTDAHGVEHPDTWARSIPDPRGLALAELDSALRDMARLGDRVWRLVETLCARPSERLGRAGEGECSVCEDYEPGNERHRLRSGYCTNCYMAWTRAGRPGYLDPAPPRSGAPDARKAWERRRRAELDAREEGAA